MKRFEFAYLFLHYLLPPLHRRMRNNLLKLTASRRWQMEVLDVGGRKSHYTIGVPAWITVSDLPRESQVQEQLHLGLSEAMISEIKARRSNVRQVLFDDMARSSLPDQSFDCVISIEVLEHVEEDAAFVRNVHRVLKPGGFFLMSTPNGDYVKNTNPDHKRHYTRQQLHSLLCLFFPHVEVEYAIKGGRYRKLGLEPWSPRHPLGTGLSMIGNLINSAQSSRPGLKNQPYGTHHLIACAKK